MTTHFRTVTGTEIRIFDFAEASLTLYRLGHSLVSYVKKASHELVAFFAVILVIGLFTAAIPVVILWAIIFALGLCFSLAAFKIHEATDFSAIKKMDRRDAINLHVKTAQTMRRMESVKSSGFLFKTPVLGYLMRSYRRHLEIMELALRTKAYPNYGRPPANPIIHAYNQNDPWQADTSDFTRTKDLVS